MRPKVLDLFCGAGGASMGLYRAGFDVIGIDHRPQPRYPFRFIQADALEPPLDFSRFDLIWASPPCQAHSVLRHLYPGRSYSCHIAHVRRMLEQSGKPYVIENVPGAPLKPSVVLCGSSFGLRVRRHRLFESSIVLLGPQCDHATQGHPIDVTGTGGRRITRRRGDHGGACQKPRNLAEAREAMGINWMTRKELTQAIPPAYAEFIGRAFIAQRVAS